MALTVKQKEKLKSQAHSLKPVVMIGEKGLTDNVLAEINHALEAHQLIKVKIAGAEKADRLNDGNTICQTLQCDLVNIIGHTLILYRKKLNNTPNKKRVKS